MSETRTFKYANGTPFTVPFVLIDGYHYVKVKKENILAQLPVILKSIDKQLAPLYVTWHWTAGNYDYPFNHYQVNIGEDYILFALYATAYEYFAHTWQRNGRNLGMSYMAMGGAVRNGVYDKDIRHIPGAIETGSLALAVIKEHFKLGWDQITDHAAWAKVDGYPGERWDNQLYLSDGNTVFSKNLGQAKWYWENKIKGKKTLANDPKYQIPDEQKHQAPANAPPVCKSDTIFNDVFKKDWYADAIDRLNKAGIVEGIKIGKELLYRPHVGLLRAELAAVLDKALTYISNTNKITLTEKPSTVFTDIPPTAWYCDAANRMSSYGIMLGMAQKTGGGTVTYSFSPAKPATRAEAAATICKVLDSLKVPTKLLDQKLMFNDVKTTDWFYEPVQKLHALGIMVGKKDKDKGYIFAPDQSITRAEIAVLLNTVLNVLEKTAKVSA